MRTNTMAMYDYATLDVVQILVQARMALSCGYRIQHCEQPTILHYNVGEQITPHFDFIDAKARDYAQQIEERGQRMITFLLYLNDAYEGGETTFPELGIVHRGSPGDGLYFINAHPDLSPDRRMLHTGSPPHLGREVGGHAVHFQQGAASLKRSVAGPQVTAAWRHAAPVHSPSIMNKIAEAARTTTTTEAAQTTALEIRYSQVGFAAAEAAQHRPRRHRR